MTAITFIIPVRHQDNARDWGKLKANLSQTIASIANQSAGDWRAVIVANEGADLPALPEGFSAERVTFPPNVKHELAGQTKDEFYDAFRVDKGRRVLAGMLAARDSRFFMIVDDDDFVSNGIAAYAADHPEADGWTIDRGYIWDDGGRLLFAHDDFKSVCGTCLIVRADHYALPERFEDASLDWIKLMLGSHRELPRLLAERGTPLASLPFRGAVYRVGHGGSHSGFPSLLKQYFGRSTLRRPRQFVRNAAKLRPVGGAAREEFFGGAAATRPSPGRRG